MQGGIGCLITLVDSHASFFGMKEALIMVLFSSKDAPEVQSSALLPGPNGTYQIKGENQIPSSNRGGLMFILSLLTERHQKIGMMPSLDQATSWDP
jgi:hypothetical protein